MEHLLPPVRNNKEKQNTYRENMKRYNLAMKNGFFFEAMLIDYALIEDRLASFLYHIGVIANREDNSTCKKTKKHISRLLDECYRKEGSSVIVRTISGKMDIVRAVLEWAENSISDGDGDKYANELKEGCISALDIPYVMELLQNVDSWREYRNEIMHGLMNKNMESLKINIADKAEEGMSLARGFDGEIKKLKKEHIRKKIGLAEK